MNQPIADIELSPATWGCLGRMARFAIVLALGWGLGWWWQRQVAPSYLPLAEYPNAVNVRRYPLKLDEPLRLKELRQVALSFATADSSARVAAFYRAALKRNRWSCTPDGRLVCTRKPDRSRPCAELGPCYIETLHMITLSCARVLTCVVMFIDSQSGIAVLPAPPRFLANPLPGTGPAGFKPLRV